MSKPPSKYQEKKAKRELRRLKWYDVYVKRQEQKQLGAGAGGKDEVRSVPSSSSSSSGNNHKEFVITETRKDQYGLARDIVFESVNPYVDTVNFLTDARNFIFKT